MYVMPAQKLTDLFSCQRHYSVTILLNYLSSNKCFFSPCRILLVPTMVSASVVGRWYVVCHILRLTMWTQGLPMLFLKKQSSTKHSPIFHSPTFHSPALEIFLQGITEVEAEHPEYTIDFISEQSPERNIYNDVNSSSDEPASTFTTREKRSSSGREKRYWNELYETPKRLRHQKTRPQTRSGHDNFMHIQKCNYVCEYCSTHVGLRYAGLCYLQCGNGGYAYDMCMTVFSLRHILTRKHMSHQQPTS